MTYSHLPHPPSPTHTQTQGPSVQFPCCLSRDQEIFLWWPISRIDGDKGQSVMDRQQLSFEPQLPLPSLACVLCVCVCWGTSRSWATPIVSCEMQSSGVAGNGQRPWRCAASGSSALWRWPDRLFSWPTQLAVAEAPFCHCWLWVGVFPLAPALPLLPLFQHWLRNRGSEVVRGWTMERGFIWEMVTFLCALGQNTPPRFLILLPWRFPSFQRSASCSFPSGDPSPGLMAPGSGSDLGFGSEIRWPKPATAPQLQPYLSLNTQLSILEQQEQNKHIFPHPETTFICLSCVFFFPWRRRKGAICKTWPSF